MFEKKVTRYKEKINVDFILDISNDSKDLFLILENLKKDNYFEKEAKKSLTKEENKEFKISVHEFVPYGKSGNKFSVKIIFTKKINNNLSKTTDIKYDDLELLSEIKFKNDIIYKFLYHALVEELDYLKPSKENILTNENYGIFSVEKVSKKDNKIVDEYIISNFVDYVYSECQIRENRDKLNGMSLNEVVNLETNTLSKYFFRVKLVKIFDKKFDIVKKSNLKFSENFNELLVATVAHFEFQTDEFIKGLSRYWIKEQMSKKFSFKKLDSEVIKYNLSQEIGKFFNKMSPDQLIIFQNTNTEKMYDLNNDFINLTLNEVNIRFDIAAEYIAEKEGIKVSNEDIVRKARMNFLLLSNGINKYDEIYWQEEIKLINEDKMSKEKIRNILNKLEKEQIEILRKAVLRDLVIDFLIKLNSGNTRNIPQWVHGNIFKFYSNVMYNNNEK